jgi:hypothetical protein
MPHLIAISHISQVVFTLSLNRCSLALTHRRASPIDPWIIERLRPNLKLVPLDGAPRRAIAVHRLGFLSCDLLFVAPSRLAFTLALMDSCLFRRSSFRVARVCG